MAIAPDRIGHAPLTGAPDPRGKLAEDSPQRSGVGREPPEMFPDILPGKQPIGSSPDLVGDDAVDVGVELGEERDVAAPQPQLPRRFVGEPSPQREASEEVRPLRLEGDDLVGIVLRHRRE
jgi:hypothetical protein